MSEEQLFTSWHSYPSIYSLGHKAIADLFLHEVLVEEKVDGSQFSFGRFGGELKCRSKGTVINVLAPDKMFKAGVEHVGSLDLVDGWTYRGEYLCKPKHNTLAYDRIPAGHVAIFDINDGHESYLSYEAKAAEAARIGLEVVPKLFHGVVANVEMFRELLATTSMLGGQKIEGVVVKQYKLFGPDKKVLLGKFVSEAFKEIHGGEWRKNNPPPKDILATLIERYKTPARWAKAAQHLAEAGKLESSPKDIGHLIAEVPVDVLKECEEEMKGLLFAWAWPHVKRGITAGLAEWYKDKLVEKQFDAPEAQVAE